MKDRLSIHLENGQAEIFEAVTVLRNGGSPAQSGLVGITNKKLASASSDPYLPETIFNVHSTGDSNIRFSSGPNKDYRSSIELLGMGNTRASGLHISYDPRDDDAFITANGYYDYTDLCVEANAEDKVVADFSLIRSSGCCGMEFSHISMSERGYVGIGVTRRHKERLWAPNAPLTIAYWCDDMCDSGTISMHEQACKPMINADYGKIYVKPWTEISPHTQALFFVDDNGTETNLLKKQDISPLNPEDGLIFGNNCNTYGGWYTPATRSYDSTKHANTYYGWGAGFHLSEEGDVDLNTLIGCTTGSGLKPANSNSNTVVGAKSLTGWTSAERNIIIGSEIATDGNGAIGGMDDSILIGRDMFRSSLPQDGTLAIGFGGSPLLSGSLLSNKHLFLNDAGLSLIDNDVTFTLKNSSNNSVVDVIDPDRAGSAYAEKSLSFTFSNSDDLTQTLLTLDSNGCILENIPNYANPTVCAPFAQLNADFRLQGAIRFQDGTSLSGLAEFELVPSFGTSGVSKNFITELNKNAYVLDYSELKLAGDVSSNIRTDNTFVAVQLDGTDSSNVGKMSLQGLADYVSSGTSSIAENCNVLIANPEAELNVNTAGISRTVMIGCDVAQFAAGWKNGVILGADAGTNAVSVNPGLDSDKPVIFIGHRAGYNADSISHAVFIGEDAGKDSLANESIFIGLNAGEESNSKQSIGIGNFALAGMIGSECSKNIEITAGESDSQRLLHKSRIDSNVSNKLVIQQVVAGDHAKRNLSIGDAILDPDAPLSVRRDSIIHAGNGNDYVQTWYCDDSLVAAIDCEGNFSGGSAGVVEGILKENMTAPTNAAGSISERTGPFLMDVWQDGVFTATTVEVYNRDKNLDALQNTFIIVQKIGSEYRPIWVSCTV